MELIKEVLGKNLISLRKQRGLSQVELANALNIASSTYNQWEKGSAWPSSANLEMLASYYGIRSTALFLEDPFVISSSVMKSELIKDLEAVIQKLSL